MHDEKDITLKSICSRTSISLYSLSTALNIEASLPNQCVYSPSHQSLSACVQNFLSTFPALKSTHVLPFKIRHSQLIPHHTNKPIYIKRNLLLAPKGFFASRMLGTLPEHHRRKWSTEEISTLRQR